MSDSGKVQEFFKENEGKFGTKRQASKYLNHYGRVYKEECRIDLSAPTRIEGKPHSPTQKSKKYRNKDMKNKRG